jgi:hypothetical protein
MLAPLAIDARTGAISIAWRPRVLFGGVGLAITRDQLGPFISNESEWDNYQRIECNLGHDLNHLAFGGWPCEFVATFQDAGLVDLRWRIFPPAKGRAWPTEGDAAEQMVVLRRTLQAQLSRPFGDRFEQFDWGEVGCGPDLHTNDPNVRITYEAAP